MSTQYSLLIYYKIQTSQTSTHLLIGQWVFLKNSWVTRSTHCRALCQVYSWMCRSPNFLSISGEHLVYASVMNIRKIRSRNVQLHNKPLTTGTSCCTVCYLDSVILFNIKLQFTSIHTLSPVNLHANVSVWSNAVCTACFLYAQHEFLTSNPFENLYVSFNPTIREIRNKSHSLNHKE